METLITVVLMGLVVVGLLTGLLSVARMADHNNRVTHVGNTAQSYTEQLKQPVEEMAYRPCASPPYPGVSGNLVPGTAYEVDISDVQFASAIPNDGESGVDWSDACPSDPEGDRGLQMLTVRVTVTRGTHTTTEFVPLVKRDARCEYSPQYDNADLGPC